jgi:hypothetical protein
MDVGPCLGCWRLVVDVPFLLFGSQGTLAFCLICVRARGLAQWLQTGTTEGCPHDGEDA